MSSRVLSLVYPAVLSSYGVAGQTMPPCGALGLVEEHKVSMPNTAGPLEAAMTRYAAGDNAAFADVYDLAAPRLFAFLVRLCHDRSLAEDLTHETFLRIHRARGVYRPEAGVLPWAFAIARRLFLDNVRSKRRENTSLDNPLHDEDPSKDHPSLISTEAPADEQLAAHRMLQLIETSLSGLPETQATAFRLLKQEGLSVAEAAMVLGVTQTTIKLRAHRAYEALRKALGEHTEQVWRDIPLAGGSSVKRGVP